MIMTFSVENWRSFRERATLNMTAASEKQHSDRLPAIAKYRLKLLPISAIYGANASGKTKFIEALAFLQYLVLQGTQNQSQKIALERFRLETEWLTKPSRFAIDVLIDGLIYTYEISLLPEKILEERLIMQNSCTAYDVFTRIDGQAMSYDTDYFNQEEIDFLNFIAKATRSNQLFLTNAVQLNMVKLRPLYDWFESKLTVISPNSEFNSIQRLADPGDVLSEHTIKLMRILGTGIDHFETVKLADIDSSLPKTLLNDIKQKMSHPDDVYRSNDIIVRMENDELVFEKLLAIHKNLHGENIRFQLNEESDGTKRLLDLIPAFAKLKEAQGTVFVIDELDRSLHTQLLEWLLKYFLDVCHADSRNQLIFTTHDVNILTQDLFRRDELWGIDKNPDGASILYSFRDFKKIRSDRNIRKVYLNGLMGAVPTIL